MVNKFILWDFDGTLGYRDGMWSGTLAQILQSYAPEYRRTIDDIRPFLQKGFPWHQHEVDHTHMRSANDWWSAIDPVFFGAFQGVGLPDERARELASLVRQHYVNPAEWKLYDDVFSTLQALTEKGWKHAILSNHVPELCDIVKALGLSQHIETIINSALVGYEKPNPRLFEHALEILNKPQTVWMVGDSISADIQGAETVGIPAILVRKQDDRVANACLDLGGVIEIMEG